MRYLLTLALLGAVLALPAGAEPVRTKHVTAELLAENGGLVAGTQDENWVALRLEMIPHWHTYWRFPGDSGLPTEVKWKLPTGWKVSEPRWQHPARIQIPPLVNYGYEGEALIGFQISVPKGEAVGARRLSASASWLVCKEECIPEKGELSLDVQVTNGKPAPGPNVNLFEKLRSEQPIAPPAGTSVK